MQNTKDPRITTIIFLQVACLLAIIIGGVLLYDTMRTPNFYSSENISTTSDSSVFPSFFPSSSVEVTDASPYMFDASGTLMISNEAWYLLYGENVENVARLVLFPQSICVNQQSQLIVCTREGGVVNGSRVRVSGNKTRTRLQWGTNNTTVIVVISIIFSARVLYHAFFGYTYSMSASNTFDELYKKLNKRQKEAVDTIEGPVMVIAGPGTGKTQILALRIASILLKTDTPPDAILAISFTESAAAEMRSRVVSLVGEAGYRVRIHTFHSLCNELIQHYPEEFSQFAGASPISEVERSRAIAEILETGSYQIIRPSGDPTHYVRAIGNGIHIVKRENISPDVYADIITQEEKEFLSRDDTYHTPNIQRKMKGFAYDIQKKIDKNKDCAKYTTRINYIAKNHFYDLMI
jgi:hypothetical protein